MSWFRSSLLARKRKPATQKFNIKVLRVSLSGEDMVSPSKTNLLKSCFYRVKGLEGEYETQPVPYFDKNNNTFIRTDNSCPNQLWKTTPYSNYVGTMFQHEFQRGRKYSNDSEEHICYLRYFLMCNGLIWRDWRLHNPNSGLKVFY